MSDTRLTVAISSDFLKVAQQAARRKGAVMLPPSSSKFRNNSPQIGLNYGAHRRWQGSDDPLPCVLITGPSAFASQRTASKANNRMSLLWIDKHDGRLPGPVAEPVHVNRVSGALQWWIVEQRNGGGRNKTLAVPAPLPSQALKPTTGTGPRGLPMTRSHKARGDRNGADGALFLSHEQRRLDGARCGPRSSSCQPYGAGWK